VLAFDPITIAASGVPVLCIDTCSLIDIMRDPTRHDMRPHERKAAVGLLNRLENGEFTCLVAEQVRLEFSDNDIAIQDEAANAIRKLRERVDRVNEIHGTFLPPVALNLSHLDSLVAPSRKIVQRWLDASVMVPDTDAAAIRALARVNLNMAPARKGKDSMKDCVVLETCLGAMDGLRKAALPATAVFLSANIREYLTETKVLKAELQLEFAARNMSYASNMAQAKAALGF
jgi:hypothetical protein